MNIRLISLAHLSTRVGNSVTVVRWAAILRDLGHETLGSERGWSEES